jgi:tripeptidyl-peptidase-1
MLWQRLLASTALFGAALSVSTSHVLHEKRVRSLAYKRERVEGDAIIPVRVGLKQKNLETGYDRLSKNSLYILYQDLENS